MGTPNDATIAGAECQRTLAGLQLDGGIFLLTFPFIEQLTYSLAEPLLFQKGTELEVVEWFDNSPNNPWNPNPGVDVFWGPQTWEEMLVGFVDFAIPLSLAPEKIFAPASVTPQPASSSGQ